MSKFPKLQIGLVGCGSFGESHLAAFKGIPYVQVTAVTDVVESRARNLATKYGIDQVTRDYRELCSLPQLDAVSVVTTEDQHLGPVLEALRHGKHVFVEKPIATNIEDGERMLEASRKAGRILMPGHLLRFEARYALVKEQLTSGRLGQIVSIFARRDRPKKQGKIYKRTPLVLETAIHDIDTMLWYTGKKVKSVNAFEVALEPGGMADLLWAVLQFEGGAVGVLQTMWLLPDKTEALDDAMQVVTTSGIANVDILHSGLTLWHEEGHEMPDVCYEPRICGSVYGALREELGYFALCALEGRAPVIVTAEDGVNALRVGLAVVESARIGGMVTLM